MVQTQPILEVTVGYGGVKGWFWGTKSNINNRGQGREKYACDCITPWKKI